MSNSTIDLNQIHLPDYIDHTLLDPFATEKHVEQWCDEADQFKFAAVCVYPTHVRYAAERLHHRQPQVCTVIGFPTGATTSATKLYEAQEAAGQGATELDVVINLAWLRQGNTDALYRELAEICDATGQMVKAILETTLLTPAEKQLAAEVCLDAGVQFLKTSTGWRGGATVEDVAMLKECARDRVGIKASGGIRTIDQAVKLIAAGATRLGTSRGMSLMAQLEDFDPT